VIRRTGRRRFIGPFSVRQVLGTVFAVAIAAVVLTIAFTPLGPVNPIGLPPPRATAFPIGPPVEGLRPGELAPEMNAQLGDGSMFQLTDLWASWCPPCQQETPVLRKVAATYADRGLVVVAVNVQETAERAREYAQRYGLEYVIGADVSAHILRRYRVYALPTQFFVGPDGVIRQVVQGPLDEAAARSYVEAFLPSVSASPTNVESG
jgi:thiol-disulfide isomerase/thioredoxin